MSLHVRRLPEKNRFAADVGASEDAVLVYEARDDGTLDLQHTLVPKEARGGGVADALVHAAVRHARDARVGLIPTCPYVAAWVERHPREADVFVTP